jgi:hypothetical protein
MVKCTIGGNAMTDLARHGSEAGYRAEVKRSDVCERCRKAHLVYNRQYTKAGKAAGLKYDKHDVLDTLYAPGKSSFPSNRAKTGQGRAGQGAPAPRPSGAPLGSPDNYPPEGTGQDQDGAGIGARLGDALGKLTGRPTPSADHPAAYVGDSETPSYIHEIDPDPEPAHETGWDEVPAEDFVINEAGMEKIRDNLGTYLSIVGISIDLVDGYCGPILYSNLDNMVERWAKVIAHYPAAAKMFLDGKGGVLFNWLEAIQATWPVLYAIYEHHLAKTVKVEGGTVFRRNADGKGPVVDATMPPMHDQYNYTVG